VVHHNISIGQRAATNEGARLSKAKYIMKLDAHCAVDEGFDVKLMAPYEDGRLGRDVTTVPRMYNLHAFDWMCSECGNRTYQGPTPTKCEKCDNATQFERAMVWKPRLSRRSDFARFDNTMHFQYWHAYEKRPESKGDIADLLCHVGAGWFLMRDRYWELGGMDERHGSWGQMGVEVSAKAWLSGGRQVVNKNTWYAHMFRTQGGDFGFPYEISGSAQEAARKHSRWLWLEGCWEGTKRPLSWLIHKFAPVPDWEDAFLDNDNLTKGIVYYTDNLADLRILKASQEQTMRAAPGMEIVSVSLKPIQFGKNIVLNRERGHLTMFKQILAGLEASTADIVYLCEHDMLYHPSHFEFTPPKKDTYYYNENTWKVDAADGKALFYYCKQTSGLCAYRELLIQHYRERVRRVEANGGLYDRNMGFEPGTHHPPRGVDKYGAEKWMSEFPNIDIRHNTNLTRNRWSQDQFRNKNSCLGWKMSDSVLGWGLIKNRFWDFIKELPSKF